MTDTSRKLISEMKPAARRDEVVRQANLACTSSNVVELTWRPSTFDPFRTQQFR